MLLLGLFVVVFDERREKKKKKKQKEISMKTGARKSPPPHHHLMQLLSSAVSFRVFHMEWQILLVMENLSVTLNRLVLYPSFYLGFWFHSNLSS